MHHKTKNLEMLSSIGTWILLFSYDVFQNDFHYNTFMFVHIYIWG